MRYLRMYIVINVLMTGVMRAAEATGDGAPAGVSEEPPQQKPEVGSEQSQTVENATVKTESMVPEQPSMQKQEEVAPPPADIQQVSLPSETVEEAIPSEPTIEEAEALHEAEQYDTQPVITPGVLQQPISPQALPSEEAPVMLPTELEPIQGINTVDLIQPQGNWLFKRYWWDYAEKAYGKIQVNVEKINEMRIQFFARRTELDKDILDPFYADIGLTQSDLQRSMQTLMSQLEQEREKEGMLSDEERELMESIKKERERLQQLNRDINAVGTLRDEADRIIDRIMDQQKRASQFKTDAWEEMHEIGRIVSDTKATELYYRIDAELGTIKDIIKHIEQDLNRNFDTLLANAREQTERIKTALQALKEQGVDLKARVQAAQEHDLARDAAAAEEEKEKEQKAAPKKTGWFASGSRLFQAAIDVALWQFLQSIWDAIMWLPRRIYSTFTSIFR